MRGRNIRVDFPMNQSCCGLPVVMMGQRGIAQDVALQNVEAFAGDHDVILTLCASCASHLKHGYAELFAAQPDRLPEIRAFADKVMDFSTFAHERLGLNPEDFRRGTETVTYHASCHLCRGLDVHAAPRELIASAARYVPAAEGGGQLRVRRNLYGEISEPFSGAAAQEAGRHSRNPARREWWRTAPAAFCISGAARKRTAPASE